MNYKFTSLDESKYQEFKDNVSKHQNNIIDFVSISDLRAQGLSDDKIADIISEYFDPEVWPIRDDPSDKVEGPFWAQVDEEFALKPDGLVAVLAGGPNFGHREYAMQPEEAKKLWEEFLNFFDQDTRVLYGVTLGDESYAFNAGILIVDKGKAGVFDVLAND